MTSRSNIYIFSRSVRTGKTTELLRWSTRQPFIAGILTPDIAGKRVLQDIATGTRYPLQTEDISEDTVSIGRFLFLTAGLQTGKQILLAARNSDSEWIVVDEAGKLEIAGNSGWEPELTEVIKTVTRMPHRKLLLVVRDTLLDLAVAHYSLHQARIIQDLKEIS